MPTRILDRGRRRPRACAGLEAGRGARGQRGHRRARAATRSRASRGCAASAVDPLDGAAVVALGAREAAELVVVGPEAPLAAGVADALADAGDRRLRPDAAAARIESHKAFCHEVAAAAGVRMARGGRVRRRRSAALAFAWTLDRGRRGSSSRRTGSPAGKGVTVCDDPAEARRPSLGDLDGAGQTARVVVEERLDGREASVIALCDGRDAVALPSPATTSASRDGDTGPNTGGMGAYSPLADLPDDDGRRRSSSAFHRPILAELARRGTPFRGALYAGLMLTADGRSSSSATPGSATRRRRRSCRAWPSRSGRCCSPRRAATCARRSPLGLGGAGSRPAGRDRRDRPGRGRLPGRAAPRRPHRGPGRRQRRPARWSSTPGPRATPTAGPDDGGRVLAVVGRGPDLAAARERRERAADAIRFDGLQRRHDIGARAPLRRRERRR